MSSHLPAPGITLDHVTIVSDRIDLLNRFFCEVAGLSEGPRPPFGVAGHWIYADGRPVVHLIEQTVPAGTGRVAPRIDHVAFRVPDQVQWQALLARVQAGSWQYACSQVPLVAEQQLFVQIAPSVVVEFVAALPSPTHVNASLT